MSDEYQLIAVMVGMCGTTQYVISNGCSFYHMTHYRLVCLDHPQVSSDSKAEILP